MYVDCKGKLKQWKNKRKRLFLIFFSKKVGNSFVV